jgi:hypothetical protein
MSQFYEILNEMSEDKNIKTISIEIKRMSGGIKFTYETRIGDETKMGLEFVNAKDFEGEKDRLIKSASEVLNNIHEACKQKKA